MAEGDLIPAELDSTIAKLTAWGRDRDEALARLRRALADTVAVVDGGTTNQGFLLELLERPEARAGAIDSDWLERLQASGASAPGPPRRGRGRTGGDRSWPTRTPRTTGPASTRSPAGDARRRPVRCRAPTSSATAGIPTAWPSRSSPRTATGSGVDGESVEVSARRLGPHERRLELPGRAHRTLTSRQGDGLLVEVDGVPHRVTRDDGGFVYSPGPSLVVSIPVSEGDIVEAGDVVAVVEAMKMESSLTAPSRGRVKQVFVGENVHVDPRTPLLALEPIEQEAPSRAPPGCRSHR